MTDLNAKRDARRRRILENSENRLLKITGRNGSENNPDDDTSKTVHSTPDPLQNIERSVNGIITDSCHKLDDPDIFKLDDTWNGLTPPHSYRHINPSNRADNLRNITGKRLNTEASLDYGDTYKDYSNEMSAREYHVTTPVKRTLPWLSMSSRTNYVLLALVVNLLLIWRLDYLFGKTIIVPWFTMVLTHLFGHGNMYEKQEGSLLFAALILCNIKPELTYKLKTIMTAASIIIGDLALYIFSFTLIHFAISCCLRDTDVLVVTDI